MQKFVSIRVHVSRKHHSKHKAKSRGKCFKSIRTELGWCVSWLAITVPSRAGEVALAGRGRHFTFSKHYFLGDFVPRTAVNSNIWSIQAVSRQFSSRCLQVRPLVVYGVPIKLRRFKNRNEEHETKIIFSPTWSHKMIIDSRSIIKVKWAFTLFIDQRFFIIHTFCVPITSEERSFLRISKRKFRRVKHVFWVRFR